MSDETTEKEPVKNVKTAFIVIVFDNEDINVQTDPSAFNFPLAREAQPRDVRMICGEIISDMAASAAGQHAHALMTADKEENKSPLWVAN